MKKSHIHINISEEPNQQGKVYILAEQHQADGTNILGVFTIPLNEQQIETLVSTRSPLSPEERAQWCSYFFNEYDLETDFSG